MLSDGGCNNTAYMRPVRLTPQSAQAIPQWRLHKILRRTFT